jgi:hypothetical protein
VQSGESKERQGSFCTRIEEEDVLRSAARLFHLEGINAKRWRGANTALHRIAALLRFGRT